MMLPQLKPRFSSDYFGADAISQKQGGNAQELARLRRLEDLRGLVRQTSPPARPSGASTPNLHDFATKTHLARLDLAVENLDGHVQQCMHQVLTALTEQGKGFEDWVTQDVGNVLKRLSSVEDRLAATPAGDSQMHARIAMVENKLVTIDTSFVPSPAAPSANQDMQVRAQLEAFAESLSAGAMREAELRGRLDSFEKQLLLTRPPMQASTAIEAGSSGIPARAIDGDLLTRLSDAEERLSAGKSVEASMQGRLESLDERLAAVVARSNDSHPVVLEERLAAVSAKVVELSSTFDKAIEDLTRQVYLQSVSPVCSVSRLKMAVNDVTAKFEEELEKINPALFADRPEEREHLREELRAIQEKVCESAAPNPESQISSVTEVADTASLKAAIGDLALQLTGIEDRVSSVVAASDGNSAKVDIAMIHLAKQLRQSDGAVHVEDSDGVEAKVSDKIMVDVEGKIDSLKQELLGMRGEHDSLAHRLESVEKKVNDDSSMPGVQIQRPEVAPTPEDTLLRPAQPDNEDGEAGVICEAAEAAGVPAAVVPDQESAHVVDLPSPASIEAAPKPKVIMSQEELVGKRAAVAAALAAAALGPAAVPVTVKEDAASASALEVMEPVNTVDRGSDDAGSSSAAPDSGSVQDVSLVKALKTNEPVRKDVAFGSAVKSKEPIGQACMSKGNAASSSSPPPSDPAELQETEKRAAAAAVVLMEKRLEGFVPVQDFARLRENVASGFENIGAQIRTATESQIANQEASLEKFLQKRRVKGWLKTHPAQYTRRLACMETRSLQDAFEIWRDCNKQKSA